MISRAHRIKIHATGNLQETVNILTMPDQSGVKGMDWSVDGQLIATSTAQGSVYVFVTKLVTLCAASFPRIVVLSSLAEATIYNYAAEKVKTPVSTVEMDIEPAVIGVGPYHFACAMNSHAWFYDLGRSINDNPVLLGDREYMAEITDIKMNALYCAALCSGRVLLHPVSFDQFKLVSTAMSECVLLLFNTRLSQIVRQQKIRTHNCFPTILGGIRHR